MATHTDAEFKGLCAARMGDELGNTYHRLYNECAVLHMVWVEFRSLYATKESRVDLLNAAAPLFFRIAQDALWDSVLLHISRLTDPAVTFGHKNLSISQLIALVDPAIKPQVEAAVAEALTAALPARDWRNRNIAHQDLDLALQRTAKPLESATRENTTAAVRAIARVLNIIEGHYNDSEVQYDVISEHTAESLLYALRDGLEGRAARLERIKARVATPEDLKPLKPV